MKEIHPMNNKKHRSNHIHTVAIQSFAILLAVLVLTLFARSVHAEATSFAQISNNSKASPQQTLSFSSSSVYSKHLF